MCVFDQVTGKYTFCAQRQTGWILKLNLLKLRWPASNRHLPTVSRSVSPSVRHGSFEYSLTWGIGRWVIRWWCADRQPPKRHFWSLYVPHSRRSGVGARGWPYQGFEGYSSHSPAFLSFIDTKAVWGERHNGRMQGELTEKIIMGKP